MATQSLQHLAEPPTPWLDDLLARLASLYNQGDKCIVHVATLDEVLAVLSFVTKIINQEGSLVEVEAPIKVLGDIHGQYQVSGGRFLGASCHETVCTLSSQL